MQDGLNRGWKEQARFSGTYRNYHVEGVKFVSPIGEVGWHTTSWPELRDGVHDFWTSGSIFYKFAVHPVQSRLHGQPIEIGNEAINIDLRERKAILAAIEDWESPYPKWDDWTLFDPTNPVTHPPNQVVVELKLANGRIVTGNYAQGFFGSIGYGNILSEEEHNAEKHWRLAID